MENNYAFVYNNSVIEQLDLYPKYGSTLSQISQKDYGNKYSFDPNIKALDLDKLEHDAHKSSIKKSMDAAIAVFINSSNIHSSSHLLLIEFRMDCVSIGQISCTELKSKVLFSSNMLSGTTPIDTKHYIFVYKSGFCEQVKNFFFRKSKSNDIPFSYLALSPETLTQCLHSKDCMTQRLEHSLEKVYSVFSIHFENRDAMHLLSLFRHWCDRCQSYYYTNNLDEYNNLKKILQSLWQQFISMDLLTNDDLVLEKDILLEDYSWLESS